MTVDEQSTEHGSSEREAERGRAEDRDLRADERDDRANERDERAEIRDRISELEESAGVRADPGEDRALSAMDREEAAQDRAEAAIDRAEAARDRGAGTANQLRAVQAAYSAFAHGDIEVLLGSLADDVVWDASDALWVKGTFVGHEGVREYLSGIAGLWEDLRLADYDIEDVRTGTLLVRGRLRGRDRNTGEVADTPFMHWVDVGGEGKISKLRILVDPDRHS